MLAVAAGDDGGGSECSVDYDVECDEELFSATAYLSFRVVDTDNGAVGGGRYEASATFLWGDDGTGGGNGDGDALSSSSSSSSTSHYYAINSEQASTKTHYYPLGVDGTYENAGYRMTFGTGSGCEDAFDGYLDVWFEDGSCGFLEGDGTGPPTVRGFLAVRRYVAFALPPPPLSLVHLFRLTHPLRRVVRSCFCFFVPFVRSDIPHFESPVVKKKTQATDPPTSEGPTAPPPPATRRPSMMRPPSPKPSPAPSPTGGPATMPPTEEEEEEEEDDPVEDGATATAAPSYQPPTPAPTADIEDTDPCGDGTCDADEDSSTCPPDCAGVVLSSTTYTTTTTEDEDGDGDDGVTTKTLISARGVQFFVVAGDRDVLIRNVETFVDVGDGVSMYDTQIEVFAKLGTYAGYEMDSDAWVRVYNGHVEVGDDGPPPTSSSSSINETTTATTRSSPTTLPLNGGEGVPIPAGSMVSFYVYADAGLACTPGRRAGYVVADDGVLRVHEGVELEGRWSGYNEDSPPVAFWGSFG